MNQILATNMEVDNKRKKNKTKTSSSISMSSLLKFFGIAILIFGVFMIGNGVYTIIQNQAAVEEENKEPTISLENKTDTTILLKVMHQKIISKVEYSWNDNTPVVLKGNNGTYLDQEIVVPTGKNTLHVLVQDEDGNEVTYDKEYDIPSNIKLEVALSKIKISYESDTLISYITYRWDDMEENTIEINSMNVNQEIDVLKGIHELTVSVVDENNKVDTTTQTIKGISKPNVIVNYDDAVEHFVIIASDDEKLTRIEFRLDQDDEKNYVLNLEDMDFKELEYTLPMAFEEGTNMIEVTVYNSNDLTATAQAVYTKR